MKTLMVQFSDLHSGLGISEKRKSRTELEAFINDALLGPITEVVDREKPDFIALVLNGDFAEATITREGDEASHANQYDLVLRRLIKPFIEYAGLNRIKFNTCIAVPGNHDVDRSWDRVFSGIKLTKKSKPIDYARLSPRRQKEFYKSFQSFHTPRKGLRFAKPPKHCNNAGVVFWPIDSSRCCGARFSEGDGGQVGTSSSVGTRSIGPSVLRELKEKDDDVFTVKRPPTLDYIRIPKLDLEKMQVALKKMSKGSQFRVAIVHHNPFATRSDFEPHMYLNEGEFIRSLHDNRFQILLHGHSHQTSTFHLTEVRRASRGSDSVPFIEGGILCIGAKSLWPGESGMDRGFNIISISQDSDSYLAEVKVIAVDLGNDALEAGAERLKPRLSEMTVLLATKSIEQLPDSERRLISLKRIARTAYSETPVGQFDPHAPLSRAAMGRLEASKELYFHFNHLLASYSVNNLTPSDWKNAGFIDIMAPFAQISQCRAAIFANTLSDDSGKDSRGELSYGMAEPLFRFSSWLCEAIRRSVETSSRIGLIEAPQTSGMEFCGFSFAESTFVKRAFKRIQAYSSIGGIDFGSISTGIFSLSRWSRHRLIEREIQFTTFESHGLQLHDELQGDQLERFAEEFLDLARIVLWEPQQFYESAAFEIIRFHESNGIPLFWLDPLRLVNRDGFPRANIGYVSLTGFDPTGVVRTRVSANTASGERPSPDNYYLNEDDDARFVGKLWGCGKAEHGVSLCPRSDYGTHEDEFKLLGSRPDLVPAVDVWYFLHQGDRESGRVGGSDLGRVSQLRAVISNLDTDCQAWLNSSIL